MQITGCKHQNEGESAEIRLVDAMQDADSLQISVNNHIVIDSDDAGIVTDFKRVPVGTYLLSASAVNGDDDPVPLPPATCDLKQDQKYTGLAIGRLDGDPKGRLLILPDGPPDSVPPDQAAVRIINAYPHFTKVDAAIDNIVSSNSLSFGERGEPILLPARKYVFKAFVTGDYDSAVAGPVAFDLSGGKSYQIVIVGNKNTASSGIILLTNE